MKSIYINEVVVRSFKALDLYGFYYDEKAKGFQQAKYTIATAVFFHLVRHHENGKHIYEAVNSSMQVPHAVPATIDLVDRFGLTQEFTCSILFMLEKRNVRIPYRIFEIKGIGFENETVKTQ